MTYQATLKNAENVEAVTYTTFRFDAGNSIQPKTNYCVSCTAHKLAICAKLKGDELNVFAAKSTQQKFKAGQLLFAECEDANTVYTIVSGDVRLSRMLDDGRRQITGFKSKGDFIGLSTNGLYTSNAEAINDVAVCQISARTLEHSLEEFSALQSQLMGMMQREVIELQNHMVVLGRKTPIEKIAHFIVERAKFSMPNAMTEAEETVELSLPMTRVDIADFLGLTIETVSRTFTKLRKLSLIELKTAHDVIVLDLNALELIAVGEK